MSEVVRVDVYIKYETDLAYLVGTGEDDEDPRWIPKSLISDSTLELGVQEDHEIEVPVWLAEEKGLV